MALNTLPLDSDRVAKTYLIANTPQFLLRELRKLAGFHEFAASNTPDDLIGFIRDVDAAKERDARNTGLAYAAAAALVTAHPHSVSELLDESAARHLVWLPYFLSTVKQSQRILNTTIFGQVSPVMLTPEETLDSVTSVTTSFRFDRP